MLTALLNKLYQGTKPSDFNLKIKKSLWPNKDVQGTVGRLTEDEKYG